MLADPTVGLRDCVPYSDKIIELCYAIKVNFLPQIDVTNVFLAAFTTAYTRMRFYQVLDRVGSFRLKSITD